MILRMLLLVLRMVVHLTECSWYHDYVKKNISMIITDSCDSFAGLKNREVQYMNIIEIPGGPKETKTSMNFV